MTRAPLLELQALLESCASASHSIEEWVERRLSWRISASRSCSCACCAWARACVAALTHQLALLIEFRAARIENSQFLNRRIMGRARTLPDSSRERLISRSTSVVLGIDALAAQRRLLEARAHRAQLRLQLAVLAVHALDLALDLIAPVLEPATSRSQRTLKLLLGLAQLGIGALAGAAQ
jgi:hypothetical protein